MEKKEVVYENLKIYCAMNYYGITIDKKLSENAIDYALRPAPMKVGEDLSVLPLRGPGKFENNGYTYTFTSNGKMDCFTGVEEIYKGDKLVYKLICHGGIIK